MKNDATISQIVVLLKPDNASVGVSVWAQRARDRDDVVEAPVARRGSALALELVVQGKPRHDASECTHGDCRQQPQGQAQRDADRVKLHAFAREHAHGEKR